MKLPQIDSAGLFLRLCLNRKQRRALKSARYYREPQPHLSRRDMGITKRGPWGER